MTAAQTSTGCSIGALLLAAGESTRFNSDKRDAKLPGGKAMLATSLCLYADQFDELLLVLRAGDENITCTNPAISKIYSEEAKHGMGSSLADAIRHVQNLPRPWDFAFIALGDMPFIAPKSLRRLYAAAQAVLAVHDKRILVPQHAGRAGHPVGFSAHFFPELAQISGDQGARELLKTHQADIGYLPLEDPGLLQDIDRPQDLPTA